MRCWGSLVRKLVKKIKREGKSTNTKIQKTTTKIEMRLNQLFSAVTEQNLPSFDPVDEHFFSGFITDILRIFIEKLSC